MQKFLANFSLQNSLPQPKVEFFLALLTTFGCGKMVRNPLPLTGVFFGWTQMSGVWNYFKSPRYRRPWLPFLQSFFYGNTS
jgi:hypothetical protein